MRHPPYVVASSGSIAPAQWIGYDFGSAVDVVEVALHGNDTGSGFGKLATGLEDAPIVRYDSVTDLTK